MTAALEHVALSVSDIDTSLAFYVDLLGFSLDRIIECPPEAGLGRIVGIPDCAARIAHLRSEGCMLELFEYTSPRGDAQARKRTQADTGFTHIGFASTDTRFEYRRLKAAGVEFLGEPLEFRPGVWIVYFRGPDGEVCELRQS